MIDRQCKLSVVRQPKLLGFSRGSVYYLPRPVSSGDLALMCRIDELHLEYPFAGSRMLQWLLKGEIRNSCESWWSPGPTRSGQWT
jgi:putative transposase